jgi:hypothetical protein
MRISRVVILVLVVVVVIVVAAFAFATLLAPKGNSSAWHLAARYPLQVSGAFGVAGQQCVNKTSYIYCTGGSDADGGARSDVFSASPASSASGNITSWASGPNPYPQNINGQACAAYSGYVYCVGGSFNANGDDVASSYYAPLGDNGTIGKWESTTAYPIPIDTQYCAAWTGYIYCVGGSNETDGTNADATATNSVWYAQASSSGIGSWVHTTSYPTNVYYPSCFVASGYIYCLGGADSSGNSVNSDYYASLSAQGVGVWTKTTAYPIQESGQACAFSSGYIYCVAGETAGGQNPTYSNAVYYASISGAGIGAWKQAGVYPLSVGTTCVVSSGYMYCVGGFDNSGGESSRVYYASLSALQSLS